MNSMSLIDIDTPVGASNVELNGYLQLKQKSPISTGAITSVTYYTDLFKNVDSPVDHIAIFKEYASRNLTTPFVYEKTVKHLGSSIDTVIELNIEIPTYQEIK